MEIRRGHLAGSNSLPYSASSRRAALVSAMARSGRSIAMLTRSLPAGESPVTSLTPPMSGPYSGTSSLNVPASRPACPSVILLNAMAHPSCMARARLTTTIVRVWGMVLPSPLGRRAMGCLHSCSMAEMQAADMARGACLESEYHSRTMAHRSSIMACRS